MERYTFDQCIELLNSRIYESSSKHYNKYLENDFKLMENEKLILKNKIELNETHDIYCVQHAEYSLILNNIKYLLDTDNIYYYSQLHYQDKPIKEMSKYSASTYWFVNRTLWLLEKEGKHVEKEFLKFYFSRWTYPAKFNAIYEGMDFAVMEQSFSTKNITPIKVEQPYFEIVVNKKTGFVDNIYCYTFFDSYNVSDSDSSISETDTFENMSRPDFIRTSSVYDNTCFLIFVELGYKDYKYNGKYKDKYVCEIFDLKQIIDFMIYASDAKLINKTDIKAPVIYQIENQESEYINIEL